MLNTILIVREHNFKINEIIVAVILGVLCRYLYILKNIIFQSLLKFLNWAQRVRSLRWLTSLLFAFSPLGSFFFTSMLWLNCKTCLPNKTHVKVKRVSPRWHVCDLSFYWLYVIFIIVLVLQNLVEKDSTIRWLVGYTQLLIICKYICKEYLS